MLRIALLEQTPTSRGGVSMPTPSTASTPTDEQVFIDKLIGQSPWSARSVTNSGFWRLQRSAGGGNGQPCPRRSPRCHRSGNLWSRQRSRGSLLCVRTSGRGQRRQPGPRPCRLLWHLLSGATGECPVARRSSRHAAEAAGERRGSIAPRHCCPPALCR
jgi:hypothetical protein